MPRRAANNPRQVRSKVCGCSLCLEEYPPDEYGERRPRRDCVGSWQARYRDPTGRQKSKNFPIKDGGKAAAEAFLDETRTAVRQRTYRDPERGKITLGKWWGEFWEVEQKKGRPTTRNRKLGVWRAHIEPKWSGYRLIDLEYMALQQWLTRDVKGYETQKKTKELLVALLDAAIKDGERITSNPAAHLEPTAAKIVKHPDDLKPPTEAQYTLIHAALPAYYQVIFRDWANETGMRPGEYAGLREHCIDEEERIAYIKEILILDGGRLRRQAAPKTDAGFRGVPLTDRAWGAYLFMKQKWKPLRTRSAIGDGFDLHLEELVLRGPRGAALNENNLRRPWRRACDQAGVSREFIDPETERSQWWPRIYEYRHDVSSRLHHAGVKEVDTQAFLGQKRGGKVTWLYTHEGEGARENVRAALNGEGSGLRAVQ
ncbi:site-specific integrase [Streptomyces albicerus]|uniref:tyrosine-type recombinase/integrase n=1 Tax=Streptomyces albicerus TaxID=2569859 RepID=UPI001CEC4A82|nr:tyrosine-type recombinase/integrase [Streptomyces albicerus]